MHDSAGSPYGESRAVAGVNGPPHLLRQVRPDVPSVAWLEASYAYGCCRPGRCLGHNATNGAAFPRRVQISDVDDDGECGTATATPPREGAAYAMVPGVAPPRGPYHAWGAGGAGSRTLALCPSRLCPADRTLAA